MRHKQAFIVIAITFFTKAGFGCPSNITDAPKILSSVFQKNTLHDSYTLEFSLLEKRPSPLLQLFKLKKKKNKKAIAAALAFPFPFGIVGLHRIYLGSAPYVPVVYIATLGGVFGLTPFIDFCALLAEKDLEKYRNNPKIFMWID
jgi:TM2 domain-containing membrane protein YozV